MSKSLWSGGSGIEDFGGRSSLPVPLVSCKLWMLAKENPDKKKTKKKKTKKTHKESDKENQMCVSNSTEILNEVTFESEESILLHFTKNEVFH